MVLPTKTTLIISLLNLLFLHKSVLCQNTVVSLGSPAILTCEASMDRWDFLETGSSSSPVTLSGPGFCAAFFICNGSRDGFTLTVMSAKRDNAGVYFCFSPNTPQRLLQLVVLENFTCDVVKGGDLALNRNISCSSVFYGHWTPAVNCNQPLQMSPPQPQQTTAQTTTKQSTTTQITATPTTTNVTDSDQENRSETIFLDTTAENESQKTMKLPVVRTMVRSGKVLDVITVERNSAVFDAYVERYECTLYFREEDRPQIAAGGTFSPTVPTYTRAVIVDVTWGDISLPQTSSISPNLITQVTAASDESKNHGIITATLTSVSAMNLPLATSSANNTPAEIGLVIDSSVFLASSNSLPTILFISTTTLTVLLIGVVIISCVIYHKRPREANSRGHAAAPGYERFNRAFYQDLNSTTVMASNDPQLSEMKREEEEPHYAYPDDYKRNTYYSDIHDVDVSDNELIMSRQISTTSAPGPEPPPLRGVAAGAGLVICEEKEGESKDDFADDSTRVRRGKSVDYSDSQENMLPRASASEGDALQGYELTAFDSIENAGSVSRSDATQGKTSAGYERAVIPPSNFEDSKRTYLSKQYTALAQTGSRHSNEVSQGEISTGYERAVVIPSRGDGSERNKRIDKDYTQLNRMKDTEQFSVLDKQGYVIPDIDLRADMGGQDDDKNCSKSLIGPVNKNYLSLLPDQPSKKYISLLP